MQWLLSQSSTTSIHFMLKCPQYVKERMTSVPNTKVIWGQRAGQTLHKVLAGWLGVSSQDPVKSLRVQHYIVVFFPLVSSNNHLKMHLHRLWTGSHCRCRGTVPLHAIKHLPEEWQGISSHSPAATPSHWPLLHRRHNQRRGDLVNLNR